MTIVGSFVIGIQAFFLQVNFELAEIHLHWPVQEAEHPNVEVEDGVGKELDTAIDEMATENTKDDAHNEEKVDDLTSDKADPTRLVDLLVSETGAAHTHSESKLDVVHEHDDHCHDDGPQELVLSHVIGAFDLEMSRQTWITLDKHVVGASKNHEVDDKNQVPDAEDDASDRIISLGYVDGLLDATPLFIWLLRSRTSELTEPVDQDTSDEVGLVELCHRISEKAWSVNVDRVHWIVEEEKETSESHGAPLFKRQLSL